jgi:DNA polymerase delta subunit 2
LEVMDKLLQWRHLAPTAPDTLTCYPFHDLDPCIIHTAPHVMFAGNQPEFATAVVKGGPIKIHASHMRSPTAS